MIKLARLLMPLLRLLVAVLLSLLLLLVCFFYFFIFIFLFFFFEFDNLGVNFSILTGLGLNFLGLLFNLLDQFACLVFGEALYSIVYVLVTALI